jgi:phospholipase/lecithinase/hemolysin
MKDEEVPFMFKSHLTRRFAVALGLAVLLAAPQPAAAQAPYSGIVVFGTSLSDPGNAFALTGEQGTPDEFFMGALTIPGRPYAKGGHHFSNGATWIEQYARSVGLGDSVRPAFGTTDSGVTNFAVGAARAYDDNKNVNLTAQVDEFLRRSGNRAPSTALYVIEMGGNDIRDALSAGPAGAGGIITQSLTSIATNIVKLYMAGAREFLIWSAPDVGRAPALLSLGPVTSGFATQVSMGFNEGLRQTLVGLAPKLPGAYLGRFDSFAAVTDIVQNHTLYGLVDVTAACITPDVAPFQCDKADEFLFWDGIHPTKTGHAILAQKAAAVIR